MTRDPITKAWAWLIVLSGGSAVVALLVDQGMDRRIAGTVILGLALLKSRIILSRYLGLAGAPSWRRGFNMVVTLFCLILLGLYLIGSSMMA